MASTDDKTMPAERPSVVIVGGGFAGLQVAKELIGVAVDVTIVDTHNFHTFLPLLYQVATAGLEPADVAYPIRTIFGRASNISFRHGTVQEIDEVTSSVVLASGDRLSYDYLVLASGATAAFFGVPGAREHAYPLYTLSNARRLRNTMLLALEEADAKGLDNAPPLTFVVVGGGPTGVETSGALTELLDICIRRDRLQIDPARTKVMLVDVADRVLTAFPDAASAYTKAELESMGVELRLGTSVTSVDATGVTLDTGEHVTSAAVIWAAGVTASGTIADHIAHEAGPSGRVAVRADLSVDEHMRIWAVGDAAAVPTGEGNEICPQLAPVAIQSGRHCGRQIRNVVEGRRTTPFRYRNKGIMATIGRRAAVARLPKGPTIKGTLGWLAWLNLHLYYLVGFRNRIRVMVNWTWRYLDWPSGPRLIVADAETAD
jgi:NADH dehydrogenase